MANIIHASETREFTTVLSAFSGKVLAGMPVEQSQQRNTLLGMLQRKQRQASGGYMYVNVGTVTEEEGEGPFVKAELLTPTDVSDVTRATYRRAIYRAKVTMFLADKIDNPNGKSYFQLVAHKLKMARQRLLNKMAADVWATTTVANGIQGVPMAIADDPTSGTYGGLSGAAGSQDWWRNKYDSTGYTISTGIQGAMDAIDYELQEWGNWEYAFTSKLVHRVLRQNHRQYAAINLTPSSPMGKKAADLGFGVIEYDGKPILWDRNCPSTSSTTGHRMYFFRDDAFYLGTVPGYDFHLTPWTELPEQEGATATLIWAGQAVTQERRALGVITGLDV